MTKSEIIKGLKAVRTIHNGNYAPYIDGAIKELTESDNWIELKETIEELRDNGGTATQQEVCTFLASLMEVLEYEKKED